MSELFDIFLKICKRRWRRCALENEIKSKDNAIPRGDGLNFM
jgi:hypothetical protein